MEYKFNKTEAEIIYLKTKKIAAINKNSIKQKHNIRKIAQILKISQLPFNQLKKH